MRLLRVAVIAAGLLLALPASAAGLRVVVRDARGQPVSDAVVTLAGTAGAASNAEPPAASAVTHTVDQRDEAFVPYVAVFRPGDRVVFRNSDVTRHHVYSFSRIKAFEQLLTPGESGTPLTLEHTGLVAVGCNIHDHMRAWLVVSDANWISVTDAAGVARFASLPAGTYRSVVWHPQLRPRQPEVAQTVTLEDGAAIRDLPVSLRLLPDPRAADPHRSHY